MKYIVIRRDNEDFMVLFPNSLKFTHQRMAECVQHIGVDVGVHGWEREFIGCEIVSAGFVDYLGQCHGMSESLQLASRPEQDTALLKSQYR